MLRGQVYLCVNDVNQEVKKDDLVTLSGAQAKSFEAKGWAVRITQEATEKPAAKTKKKTVAKEDPKKDSK